MELDRFQVLKSYAESIKTLAEADMRLAQELSFYIIQYWIYGAEPPKETNPIVLALFNQIKLPIDNCRAKSQNAKKDWEKVWNQIEIKSKSNWNQTEIKPEQNIKIKNNKKVKTNNDIILKNDTAKAEYGNPEINLCLELIKKYNGWLVDWTTTNQRRYSKLLIDKLNKLEKIQSWEFTWEQTLEVILQVISKNKYYSSKITSPESIYRNLAVLMQKCKEDFVKTTNANTVLPTI